MSFVIPVDRVPVCRRSLGEHPGRREKLRARVLSERRRIERLSRIRELVLGFQDGLLVPLGVVTGLAGASVKTKVEKELRLPYGESDTARGAEEESADPLVVGSLGLHAIAAIRSVCERVAHQAMCSVLVVRDGHEGR